MSVWKPIPAEQPPSVFAGLKVLDVGSWVAGPVATTILADYGADVIKVETPEVGDGYRYLSTLPMMPQSELPYLWMMDGRNKRSITLNLKSAEGMDILHRLVRECDVYATNQPLGMRRSLGLRYEDLKPLNPSMIYASLTAYGEQGPDCDREGFDLVAYWARSGLMDLVRADGAPPAQAVPGMGDHPTSVAMYASIVTALLHRQQTGEGTMVHTSLIANGTWAASCIGQARLVDADFSNFRNPALTWFTRELFETLDNRWLQFTMIRSDEEQVNLLSQLDCVELLADPRFADPQTAFAHGAELVARLRERIRERTAAEWMQRFKAAGVPAVLVRTIDEIADDPQLQANGIVVPSNDETDRHWIVNHPVNVEGAGRIGVEHAPEIGEDTDAVLAAMGFAEDDIARLHSSGAV